MSNEYRLAAELAAIEASLSATSLPGSSVDRNILFYRAGWSAASASSQLGERRARSAWPALCVCLAALLVIIVSIRLRSEPDDGGAQQARDQFVDSSIAMTDRDSGVDKMSLPTELLRRRNELIRLGVRGGADAPVRNAPGLNGGPPSMPKTRGELLAELLSNS